MRIERTSAALPRTSTLLVGPYQWECDAVLCHQPEDLLVLAQKPKEGQAYLAHCQEVQQACLYLAQQKGREADTSSTCTKLKPGLIFVQ